jgi:hypothetical protein
MLIGDFRRVAHHIDDSPVANASWRFREISGKNKALLEVHRISADEQQRINDFFSRVLLEPDDERGQA